MLKLLFLINLLFGTEYHCVIESGDVAKLKFRGVTMDDAAYRTSKACLSARIHNYMITKLSEPSTERRILFMEDCVNKTFCKQVNQEQTNEN